MNDVYQPIYDAIRSRLPNCDIGHAVESAIRAANISHYIEVSTTMIAREMANVAQAYVVPSAIYRPALFMDGNQWCVLYGANLQDGVAGFGDTPENAMRDFDNAWRNMKASATQKDGA